MASEIQHTERAMTFWEHTAELLSRLKIIIISIVFSGFFVAFWPLDIKNFLSLSLEYTPLVSIIMKRMIRDLLPSGASLIAGRFMDTAYIYLVISLMIGVILSSPVIAYELYSFFNPAMHEGEKRFLVKIMFPFIGLMLFGAFLSYWVILPITFRILMWFITSAGALPFIILSDFIYMIVSLVIGIGLLYTSPVFILFLVDRGVLSSSSISGNRKMVYAAFIIVTAVLTPDPTIISDIILLFPFIILFEVTIFITKRMEKKRK